MEKILVQIAVVLFAVSFSKTSLSQQLAPAAQENSVEAPAAAPAPTPAPIEVSPPLIDPGPTPAPIVEPTPAPTPKPPQFVSAENYQKILKRGVPEVALKRVISFMQAHMGKKFHFKNDMPMALKNATWTVIIDYTQPSVNYRCYLINLKTGVVERYLVAHGRNTGEVQATDFSNSHNSNKTSLGLYLTGRSYQSSRFGTGRILYGLETFNDEAHLRGIVIHGAQYMSDTFIRNNGRAGRSQGCPAMERNSFKRVHNILGAGALFLHYHKRLPQEVRKSPKVKLT